MKRYYRFLLVPLVFCATMAAVYSAKTPRHSEDSREARSGAMAALEFWSDSRAYPFKDIPPDKYNAAFQLSKRRFKSEPRTLSGGGPGWRYIGPDNLAGRTISVALNPLNPSTIYAGSASGGLWRSYTGGVAGDWKRVATGYPVLGVGAIAISPADSNVMYIGTGEVYRYQGAAGGLAVRTTRGSYGMGILKTTDGGTSWTKSLDWSYNEERGVQSVKINPLNPNTVWAATTEGVYKSTDAGGSWTQLLILFMCEDIVIHATDTNRVMITSGNLHLTPSIFRTTDGGTTWDQVSPIDFTGKALLDSPPSFPDIVFASIADDTTGIGGLWKSTNFGSSWIQVSNSNTNGIFGVQGWYSHYVAVYPTNPSIVFHASVNADRSTNGGVTFSQTNGLYSDNHDFAYDPTNPNILYSANDDGIYRSTDFGSNFTHVSVGLGTGQLYNGFANSSTDSLLAITQSQDHIPGYRFDGSSTWAFSVVDESGWTAIDPVNDSLMYAVDRYGGNFYRSTDRGVTFNFSVGLGSTGAWNSPIIVSPSNRSTIYAGQTRIYKSVNSGANFSATNGNLELDGNPAISIAISATSPDTLYVGTAPIATSPHVFRTTNGGSAWTNVTGSLPDRYPLDLAVDPSNSRNVYAAYGGYGTGHVFRSSNAGVSWTDVSGSLPDIPATALLVDPRNPGNVYVGTDLGVYVSTNSGTSWNVFNDGLPEAVLVSDLTMTPSNRTLRIATHGNGAFERRMPGNFPWISVVAPAGGEHWKAGTIETISWEHALLSTVRLQYSTNNGTTWNLIADNVPNTVSQYVWTIPTSLTLSARVRVVSTTDTTIAAQSVHPFVIYLDGNIVEYHTLWNLLSLPVAVSDHGLAANFPGATSKAFTFGTTYTSVDSLKEGSGYWIKFGADGLVALSGDTVASDTIAVHGGWNLVGSLTTPCAIANIEQDPPGLVSTLYYGYNGSYAAADSLRPGAGYWVKCTGSGELVRSSVVAAKSGAPGPLALLGQMSSITVTGADSRSQTLYFGSPVSGMTPETFEAPPLPPSGGFDVRFASNRLAELFTASVSKEVPILLTSCIFPVTVAWNCTPGSPSADLHADLHAGMERIALEGSGSVVLAQPRALTLSSGGPSAPGLPEEFALHQNYPNPFNPATIIRYELPSDADVRLSVYSLLGEEVAQLIDGRKSAGSYTVRWNAGDLPSGVYLARLTSGRFTSTLKMLLMK